MQTPKASSRTSSSDAPQKVSPRGVRQLKPKSLDLATASSSNKLRKIPNDQSPKVVERRSPRSPMSEKKRPNRISELEAQISKLQEDLSKAKEQLTLSESMAKQAEQGAEESKIQLLAISTKLDESEKKILELSEFQKILEGDQKRQAKVEEQSVDCVALGSAMDVIQELNSHLELVAKSGEEQTKQVELTNENLQLLNVNLADMLSLSKNLKNQLSDSKETESLVEALEDVKKTVEKMRYEGMTAMDASNSTDLELRESTACVNSLKTLVGKIKVDLIEANKVKIVDCQKTSDGTEIELELSSLKSEIEQQISALETAETKYHEEQIQNAVQIRTAHDLVEQTKSEMSFKVVELEKELKKSKVDIEVLKADLMDKETELQGISEENEGLRLKLEQMVSIGRESKLEKELTELNDHLADLKANYMDKETEFQCVSEENELLKLEINRRKSAKGKDDDTAMEVESARASEREALTKLGNMAEEAERNNRKAAKMAGELDMAQSKNSDLEAEMRKLKVQSDQWRKAAEAAAAMLSAGNDGNFIDRSKPLDGNYDSITVKDSPYIDETNDDLLKKKNGKMLKKIGVLWKKQQK